MDAIKRVQRYLEHNRDTEQAIILRHLALSLAEERPFALAELYSLGMPEFELAMQMLDDWRLDRHYARRMRLLDDLLPPRANVSVAANAA